VSLGIVVGIAALGAAGGAALPTAAYRLSVPWREPGQPPVPPRDTCRYCQAALPSGVPGWLRLGSRCAHCRRRLGPPGWLLGGVAALACAGLAVRFGPSPLLVPYLLVALLGVLIAAVDLTAQRIPDALILPGAVATVVLFAGVAGITGEWRTFGRALLAGLVLTVAYVVRAILPGANVGGGDVVLAGVLGIYLGWLGWPAAVIGAMLPWLIQAPISVGALLLRKARLDTMLPLGPAMLAGSYLAIVGLPVVPVLLRP